MALMKVDDSEIGFGMLNSLLTSSEKWWYCQFNRQVCNCDCAFPRRLIDRLC